MYRFSFVLLCIWRQFSKYKPPVYLEGRFNGGFFYVTGLGGLYMEGIIFGILRYVILMWFYKHQGRCIPQGIGPHLLFYPYYFTDEHVRKELHKIILLTMFLLTDSCKIIWTLLLFCYPVSSLGEIKNSYGFDSSGKKALDSEFSEYGQSFGVDDVVGCYLVSAWTVIKSHSCSRS